jgi:RND family efflux transporter MFP subunit
MTAMDNPDAPDAHESHGAHEAHDSPEGHDPHDSREQPKTHLRAPTVIAIGVGLAVVLIALLAMGVTPRVRQSRGLNAAAEQKRTALPIVRVITPVRAAEAGLTLAATTQAIQDSIIYARTSGYLKRRHVDIGDRVKAGQLIAEIESPEVDAQLQQARANLAQAEKNLDLQVASLDLAKVTMERFVAANAERAVAVEQVDQSVAAYQTAQAAVAAAEATVASNRATVDQFLQLTSFQRVVAPFAGTVTQRNVDVGALVTAGSPTDNTSVAPSNLTGTPSGLFEISQVDRLRVFINVPQPFAPTVQRGMPVTVRVRGHFDEPVTATISRTASALDPGTRTLLTQVDIPNESGVLLPGMFVYVDLHVAPAGTRWRVPSTSVIFDAEGTRVVTVDGDVIRYRPVELGRDFGEAIDIQAGLHGNETIVLQPSVSLKEGQRVRTMVPQRSQQSAK